MRTISFRSAQSGLVCNGKGDCALDSKTTPPSYECVCEGNRKGPDCVLCKESFTGGNCELECVGTCNEPKGSCICNLTNASQAVCLCNPNFLGGGGIAANARPILPVSSGLIAPCAITRSAGGMGSAMLGSRGTALAFATWVTLGRCATLAPANTGIARWSKSKSHCAVLAQVGLGTPAAATGFWRRRAQLFVQVASAFASTVLKGIHAVIVFFRLYISTHHLRAWR